MKTSIYIATNDMDFKQLLTETFADSNDFRLTYLNRENCSLLKSTAPNILIIDLIKMTNINKILATVNSNKTSVIMVNSETPFYSKSIKYYIKKPILAIELKQLFYNCINHNDLQIKKLDTRLSDIFLSVGIPPNTKGFHMLITAIQIVIDNPEYITMVTKKLYPEVARIYSSSPSIIERDMRHSLLVAHTRGTLKNINRILGANIIDSDNKPTNSEFISLMAEQMQVEGYI